MKYFLNFPTFVVSGEQRLVKERGTEEPGTGVTQEPGFRIQLRMPALTCASGAQHAPTFCACVSLSS